MRNVSTMWKSFLFNILCRLSKQTLSICLHVIVNTAHANIPCRRAMDVPVAHAVLYTVRPCVLYTTCRTILLPPPRPVLHTPNTQIFADEFWICFSWTRFIEVITHTLHTLYFFFIFFYIFLMYTHCQTQPLQQGPILIIYLFNEKKNKNYFRTQDWFFKFFASWTISFDWFVRTHAKWSEVKRNEDSCICRHEKFQRKQI